MIGMIKNIIKRNEWIVRKYEYFFTPIHERMRRVRLFISNVTEKTHYSYGKLNKNKKFFIIDLNHPQRGILSTVFRVVPYIEYAVGKGYIPIVDGREPFSPMIQDEENAGKENAWEYYFKQPVEQYSLDEVYQSKHVIHKSKNRKEIKKYFGYNTFPMDREELMYWHDIFSRYIKVNETVEKRITREKSLFPKEKILGVFVRAGYRFGGLRGHEFLAAHPKGETCEACIEKIRKKMELWKYNYFFLSCDDREYSEKIAEYFGHSCVRLDRPLVNYFKNGLPVEEEKNRVELEGYTVKKWVEDYLVEIYLLSYCDSLYTYNGTGAEFAYIMNGGRYKNVEIIETDYWTKDDFKI